MYAKDPHETVENESKNDWAIRELWTPYNIMKGVLNVFSSLKWDNRERSLEKHLEELKPMYNALEHSSLMTRLHIHV